MPTPKWTYNRLTRCINSVGEVMYKIKDIDEASYKKLHNVYQSLTGLAVMIKKEGDK